MKILGITDNSIAQELDILAGDELVAFDGHAVEDILDYEYYSSQENFTLTYSHDGQEYCCEVEKEFDEEIGLELDREIPVKSCKNNCIFCFVSQLPKTEILRDTLHVKDDDYRHSFISGNYVTLTNLTKDDCDRIIRLRLSPLYISVHSTDYELRNKMLGVKKAPDVMEQIKTLYKGGITLHAQIVYCPNFNEDIDKSIAVLSEYCASLAIVPVGLTKDCNKILKPVDKADALKVIKTVEEWQPKLLDKIGTRFVFAADEFYVKAEYKIPEYEEYEDFNQIENGIGLLAAFSKDMEYALEEVEESCNAKSGKNNGKNKAIKGKNSGSIIIGDISIATGKSAFEFITSAAKTLSDKFGGKITVYCVENEFFGDTVTVAGLVVGRDILKTLKNKPLGERLLIPKTMLREFNDVFLDNMTLQELQEGLGVKIQVCGAGGEDFVTAILNRGNV